VNDGLVALLSYKDKTAPGNISLFDDGKRVHKYGGF